MLQLKINKKIFDGWEVVRITRGLKQVSSTFELTVSDKWEQKPWQIRPGDQCELLYKNTRVITGYVDSSSVSHDAENHTVNISGRSKTSDLVDCSALSTQFKRQKITAIASALAKPYGISVTCDVDVGKAFATWKPDEGVTVYEALDKLAKLRGLLLTDNEKGDLLITRAGVNKSATKLELGKNIKSGSASFDVRERFSDYRLKGQQRGNDNIDASQAAHITASAKDTQITRYRNLLLTAEDQVDTAAAKTRIQWEMNNRIGNSQSFTVTAVGWDVNGVLWQPNTRIKLTDKYLGIDTELLIVSVSYTLDDNGTLAILVLQPGAALLPVPIEEKTKTETTPLIWTDLNA